MYSYYAAYLIGARDQGCEDKILLVHPFICVVSPSLTCTLYLSASHAHVHTHCVKWLFHLENCQNIPREHISLFLSSVSSSRGCVGVCQKCAGIDKTHGAKQLCFIQSFSLSLFSLPPPPHSLFLSLSLPCIGCEYPASEKSDQTDSQASVSQCHRGCQSMLVPSCPTMHRARPTLLLPLLLVLGLLLHLADAQSKWTAGFQLGLKCSVLLGWDGVARVELVVFLCFNCSADASRLHAPHTQLKRIESIFSMEHTRCCGLSWHCWHTGEILWCPSQNKCNLCINTRNSIKF